MYGTAIQAYTNSVPDQHSLYTVDKNDFAFYTKCVTPVVLLLFRYSARSLNAQEEHLATSPQLVTKLQLPHAIVVRLHVCKTTLLSQHWERRVFEQYLILVSTISHRFYCLANLLGDAC